MAEPANGIVDDLRGRESLVSALVGEDPEARAEESLDGGVDCPESGAERRRGDGGGRHVGVEEVESCGEAGNIAGDIVETQGGVALEALLGDGADDVSHGVVGDLEFVAVGVD